MGWRCVVRSWAFAVLLVAASCGGSKGKPDGGTGGIGVDGGSGAASITRGFTLSLNKKRDVDVLFLIDDSSSMATAQATLRQSLARFVAALRNGPDGLPNLHIAVVSSDMGAGDGSIAGCNASSGKQGVFQYTARGTCTATGLNAGATYISDVGGVKNYTGNMEDVLGCIAALGETGCGFEHQFAAITRALGVDGLGGPPAENQGFLRPDAYLVVILLTDEDDCSVSLGNGPNGRIPLFDVNSNTNITSQLGPPANFRCNEFGHLCSRGGGTLMHPDRNAPNLDVAAMVTYDNCVSNDTEGFLLGAVDTANRLKGLKADQNQILVHAITGPTAPYTVTWKTPSTVDTSCNTNRQSCPWPVIAHSCTTASGSFADPGVRTTAFVNQFGSNGAVSSICDSDFGPALEQLATRLGAATAGRCISDPIADDPSRAGYQPQCSAEMFTLNAQGNYTAQAVPPCADNGGVAPCWSLSIDASGCQRPEITLATAPPASAIAHYECVVCTAGVVGQGCTDPGPTGHTVGRLPGFGKPCEVGVSVADDGMSGVDITSFGPACPSQACLLPAAEKDPRSPAQMAAGLPGTGPVCTSGCTTNADCANGMLGNSNDANDRRCRTGFACTVPTTVGDYCCEKMCVCRDFIFEPAGGFQTPAVCMPGTVGVCPSVR